MSCFKLFCQLMHPSFICSRFIHKNPNVILIPNFDEPIVKKCESGEMHVFKHPGKSQYPFSVLDIEIQEAIRLIIGDSQPKKLAADADVFSKVLEHREVPLSRSELMDKSAVCYWDIYKKLKVDLADVSKDKYEQIEAKIHKKAERLLKVRTHKWYPIEYTRYIGKQYLVNRMPSEYAIIRKVFGEIKQRCPDFRPHSLFDLGSGVGTVSISARKFWNDSIQEYYNVDPSPYMHQIARELLTGGDPNVELPFKNVIYRQFMPSRADRKYSITASSFTLLEFSSAEERLKNILQLWSKTEDFMVIVEKGNAIGFRLISEIRDFILEVERNLDSKGVHIFSPCPHELSCPMKVAHNKSCLSAVSYERFPISRTRFVFKEKFCFIVIKKGKRSECDELWPRVVIPSKISTRRTQCYLCSNDGKLRQFLFQKTRVGTIPNQICRMTKIGERIPVTFSEYDISHLKSQVTDVKEVNATELPEPEETDY